MPARWYLGQCPRAKASSHCEELKSKYLLVARYILLLDGREVFIFVRRFMVVEIKLVSECSGVASFETTRLYPI